MQDRFKFRYVFKKDFGGKTGICYKMPIFDLNDVTDENFNKVIKGYTDYDYKLVSIEQSTGLKDKNGKLIFEGDILQDKYVCLHPISWNKKGFYEADTFALAGFYKAIQEDMEIIGNIYENPELLKEANNE